MKESTVEVKKILTDLIEIIFELDQQFSKDEPSVKISRILHIEEAKKEIVKVLETSNRKGDK